MWTFAYGFCWTLFTNVIYGIYLSSFAEESSSSNWIRIIHKDKWSWMGSFLMEWAFVNYIALHLIVFLFLGKKKVRKQRKHKVPNTSDMENCYPAMYFLLSYRQCSFLLPALCQLKIWTFHLYIIERCVLSISIAICSVYLFLVGG